MDLRKIKKLIDILEESNLAELEIKEGEEVVRLSRFPKGMTPMAMAAPMARKPAKISSRSDAAMASGKLSITGVWLAAWMATISAMRALVSLVWPAP